MTDPFWSSTEATLCPYCGEKVARLLIWISCVHCGAAWTPSEHYENWIDRANNRLKPLTAEAQS